MRDVLQPHCLLSSPYAHLPLNSASTQEVDSRVLVGKSTEAWRAMLRVRREVVLVRRDV